MMDGSGKAGVPFISRALRLVLTADSVSGCFNYDPDDILVELMEEHVH